MTLNIGWYGTGIMGKSMAKHILKAGHNLNIYNRTKSKTDELILEGAKFLQPQDLAQQSDILFTMLGFPQDVEEIVLNNTTGLLKFMKPNSILVDHTSSTPALAKKIYEIGQKNNIGCIDAPVSGGDLGAKNGTLLIMAGGDETTIQKVNYIFKTYGKQISIMGPAGFGQQTKITNQILLSGTMISLCESILYAQKSGLDPVKVIEAIRNGAATSKSLDLYSDRLLKRDFAPGFFIDHYVKDLKIALDDCKRLNLNLPGLQLANELYLKVQKYKGGGQFGTQALILALEEMNQK